MIALLDPLLFFSFCIPIAPPSVVLGTPGVNLTPMHGTRQQFPSLRRIAEACLPDGDGRVVDAGCGTGALVPFLKEAGVREGDVVGIDMSPEVWYTW